jgi:Flp pilus assembly secretin CpaC
MKSMVPRWLVVGFFCCLIGLPGRARAESREVELGEGEQRVLDLAGVYQVSVSESSIADLKVIEGSRLLIYGKAEGKTQFLVFRKGKLPLTLKVSVRSKKVEQFKYECEKLLGSPCTDLIVAQAGSQVALSGTVRDIETYHKVRRIRQAFPDVKVLVSVEPRVLDALVTAINEELKRQKLERAQVRRVGAKLLLEGDMIDEADKKKAQIVVDAVYEAALGQ